jgi:hypothetical protein
MNRLLVLAVLLCGLHTCLKAQASVDFHPKSFERELNRMNGGHFALNELEDKSEANTQTLQGKFFAVSGTGSLPAVKYAWVGRVKTCRVGGCEIETDQPAKMESEYFDYFILFDPECNVRLVKIYNYQASHGQEVTAKGWLKQFVGYDGKSELLVGKQIDAVSGATISVNAIAFDVEYRTGLLRESVKRKAHAGL